MFGGLKNFPFEGDILIGALYFVRFTRPANHFPAFPLHLENQNPPFTSWPSVEKTSVSGAPDLGFAAPGPLRRAPLALGNAERGDGQPKVTRSEQSICCFGSDPLPFPKSLYTQRDASKGVPYFPVNTNPQREPSRKKTGSWGIP